MAKQSSGYYWCLKCKKYHRVGTKIARQHKGRLSGLLVKHPRGKK